MYMKLREFTNDVTEALLKNRHNVDTKNIAVVNYCVLNYYVLFNHDQRLSNLNHNHKHKAYTE